MNNLKKERELKNVTLKEVAKKVGIAESQLSFYERGKRQPKDKETWQNLADYYQVSVPYLMGLSDVRNEVSSSIDIKKYLESDDNLLIDNGIEVRKKGSDNSEDITFDELTDLQGNKIFENNSNIFNTHIAELEFVNSILKRIKGSDNYVLTLIIKMTDPKSEKYYFTVLYIYIDIQSSSFSLFPKQSIVKVPCQLSFPNKIETINSIVEYETNVSKIKGITNDNISESVLYHYFSFQRMLDKSNKNTKKTDDALIKIFTHVKIILNNKFKTIEFNDENKIKFNLNFINEQFYVIEV
ncbi:helix-turn-helix domain-containing protein [Vagococcus fluvialis]|uniref:helix-turn-helix domain-containing protein n=1 Tax=Vagococcus fluvialis TaxID=2738 RepID=UPI00379351C6